MNPKEGDADIEDMRDYSVANRVHFILKMYILFIYKLIF